MQITPRGNIASDLAPWVSLGHGPAHGADAHTTCARAASKTSVCVRDLQGTPRGQFLTVN